MSENRRTSALHDAGRKASTRYICDYGSHRWHLAAILCRWWSNAR